MVAPLAILFVSSAMVTAASGADEPVPGSQGTDTRLPATDSEVTVSGRGPFASLQITVNQTEKLTNQAVSVSWKGAAPTTSSGAVYGSNFLQMMQCWGDDDGTVADNPGPPPEQCVFGAIAGTFGGPSTTIYPSSTAVSRIISRQGWANYDPAVGFKDPNSVNVWRPFRAVDGTVVNDHTDVKFNPSVVGGTYWKNGYFDVTTTNEVGAARTGPDGTGAELFQVNTGVESSGLGCGQRVERSDDGSVKVPKCWLVIVPRGLNLDENAPTGVLWDGVLTSPLAPEAWQHRIAIPLEFNSVDSPCRLGAAERRISGGEVAFRAVANWQPTLCGQLGLPPFNYSPVGDQTARRQLNSTAPGSPGMVAVSRPIEASRLDPNNPVVYAPISVSGVGVGFNLERAVRFDAPKDELSISGIRVSELNLTPRLVAKLLTQSYVTSVSVGNSRPPYEWIASNPRQLGTDPDFLRFNPEFAFLSQNPRTFSGLSLPAGNSDAAQQVWEWILADPEAKAWLDGAPDEWGMVVNPVYATTAAANSSGFAFGTPAPNTFPKSDSYCYQAKTRSYAGEDVVPPLLCGTDWMPYARSFAEAASVTRAAYDSAKIVENPFPLSSADAWSKDTPQTPGSRTMLSITDTPSAARYGVQMARLSRAGDDRSDRTFIAPDDASLTAGVYAMRPLQVPDFLEPDPTVADPTAYPLTALTYAAISPLVLDQAEREDYASFIDYAIGPGQVPGLDPGQLPLGYVPLPSPLIEQGVAASATIRDLTVAVPAPTAPEPAPVTTPPAPVSPTATAPARTPARTATPSKSPTTPAPAAEAPTEESTVPTGTEPPATTVAEVADAVSSAPAPAATTPLLAIGRNRLAVPGLGIAVVLSALGALEVTKRPRRTGRPPSGASS
jgi:hypothetical protein